MTAKPPIISIEGVTKRFGTVAAQGLGVGYCG